MTFYYLGPHLDKSLALTELSSMTHIAIDTETINLKNRTCIGIGLSNGIHTYYFPVLPEIDENIGRVLGVIHNPDVVKIYHNVLYDLDVLTMLADDLGWEEPDYINVQDTMLMAKAMGMEAGLDVLSQQLLDKTNQYDIKSLISDAGRRSTMLDVDQRKTATKCMYDAEHTWELYYKLGHMWPNSQCHECYDVDIRLVPKLKSMEHKGLGLNKVILLTEHHDLEQRLDHYKAIADGLGFNPASNLEVGNFLAQRGNSLPITRSGRQLEVSEEILSELSDPMAQFILKYRQAAKLLSTYVVPWLGSDRAWTHFRMDLSTGRLASFNRNLQNIPPDMRKIFRPDHGVYTWIDLSQVEMRIFAYMSGDDNMSQAYANGEDIHAKTQLALWPGSDIKDPSKRLVAKTMNFAMVFNASPKVLSVQTKLPIATCQQFRKKWLGLYHQGHEYMDLCMAEECHYVESAFGRRMRLPLNQAQSHIDKCKINYRIQGTAADIIKRAMVSMAPDTDLRLQVHDELVVDGQYEFDIDTHIHPDIYTPYETKVNRYWS